MHNNHEDICIPQELASKMDFKLDVIDCSDYNTEFDKINTKNVSMVQSDKKKFQYYNYYSQFQNKLIISGNVSPLIKELFHPVDKVSAINLARLSHYHNSKFALEAISEWLNGSLNIAKEYNVIIEKLFYWELRFGTWAPMYNSELDIAVEEFSPYNCRDLINNSLSTPASFRIKPDHILYTKLINNLWPELLEISINPHSNRLINKNKKKFILKGMDFLRKIKIYNLARFFYRKLVLR